MCWSFCLTGKKEMGQHTGAGYIRDRALHCYCCFILLTQLGKQPTLALSIQAHGLQRDPDSSAHTSASDKGSHGASGDSVKTVIHDKELGELVSAAAEVISRAFGCGCDILSAHRNSE